MTIEQSWALRSSFQPSLARQVIVNSAKQYGNIENKFLQFWPTIIHPQYILMLHCFFIVAYYLIMFKIQINRLSHNKKISYPVSFYLYKNIVFYILWWFFHIDVCNRQNFLCDIELERTSCSTNIFPFFTFLLQMKCVWVCHVNYSFQCNTMYVQLAQPFNSWPGDFNIITILI